MNRKESETITENIFRSYYSSDTFIEKSAIPKEFGFESKKGSGNDGYVDARYFGRSYFISKCRQ